ncbi:MAG: GNAT family protein [Pseudomonadota bacterium]
MQTARLEFAPVGAHHAAEYQAVMSSDEMGAHTDVPCQPNAKRAAGFVAWMARLNSSGKGRAWALLHEDAVIGFIRLNRIDKKMSRASVGYEFGQAYWGQGLATEAVRALVDHAHDALSLHRLEAVVFNGNDASARVLEKAGFLHEGVQRERILHRGVRRDIWHFGRLASDPMRDTRGG